MLPNENIEIVLVEDNVDDAELMLRVLKKRAFKEKTLHLINGEEVLNIFFGSKAYREVGLQPKLIILDIKMPKVDGLTVLKQLKKNPQTNAIPVMIFSSSNVEKDIVTAYELGANCYVIKPMEYDQFVSTVERILDFWLLVNETYN